MNAASVLELWRKERDQKRAEAEARAKQAASETFYRAAWVGTKGWIPIHVVELQAWAKQHGMDKDKLQAVLEGRAKEIRSKNGQTLRAHPFVWFENVEGEEVKQYLREEDAREAKRVRFAPPEMLTFKQLGGTR